MPRLAPISRRKFEEFLVFIGCYLKRRKGDHLIYDRADLRRPVVLTTDREVPVFIIRNNLRTLKTRPSGIFRDPQEIVNPSIFIKKAGFAKSEDCP